LKLKLKLKPEKYLTHCSFYHEHGMPEDMKKLVMSAEYQRGGITEHECFSCETKVHYYLPELTKEERRLYADLVWETFEEGKEVSPKWRIEEDLYVMYLCHSCGTWFIDERWSDIH
jgi:histidinol phosphatase-like PHP family hydrolase